MEGVLLSAFRPASGGPGSLLWLVPLLAVAGCIRPSARTTALKDLEQTPWDHAWGDAERVAFSVNGEKVTYRDYYRRVFEKVGLKTLMVELVDEELFRQEARRLGVEVSSAEVEHAVGRFLEGMAQERGGIEKLTEFYAARGITLEELRGDLASNLKAEVLRRKVTKALRRVDDPTLREYYEKTYKRKRYFARHIAYSFQPSPGESEKDLGRLKLQAYDRAVRAAELVRGGADFATLAKMESDEPLTAPRGGDLGAISEASPLPAEFKEVIFALAPLEVSAPVENPRFAGFHVFQVTEIVASESFVTCVDEMKKELEEKEPPPEEIARAVDRLRSRARITWGE
ncbi:MAG: peptidylprolyl isomerase [Planctomycetota bacterium]|nr:peptidylprolyl isomerase [Planctomycetota bacterium]